MNTVNKQDERIAKMIFGSVYPHYLAKVEKKGRTKKELHQVIEWLTGYDEEKSLQRTIRKPQEFLPEIKKATRAKTEKLFETLKTTETKLNGRINGETILLAAFNK